jgi:hypothetical protein
MTQDDFHQLWHCHTPSPTGKGGKEMLAIVVERTRAFDRRIVIRNTVECLAAALVVLVNVWLAWKAPSAVERAGFALVAASGVWIAFCILRFGAGRNQLDPGADLTAYRQMLVDKYDRQIRLLRNVKYWYLLPPYIGILISILGTWSRLASHGHSSWAAPMALGFVTVVFALVWIANEVVGVRHIERLKGEQLSALEGR